MIKKRITIFIPTAVISSYLFFLHYHFPNSSHTCSNSNPNSDPIINSGKGKKEKRKRRMSSLLDKAKEFVAEKIAHVPKPEASVTGVSFKSVTRQCITLHSEVDVNNPYSHRLPICDVSYTLKSNDKVIASGTLPDPGWIAASGITKLELPMNVPYDFLISIVKDIGRDWDIDYVLEVGLTIDLPVVGNITIPLSTKGEFKLPTLKDFFS